MVALHAANNAYSTYRCNKRIGSLFFFLPLGQIVASKARISGVLTVTRWFVSESSSSHDR